MFTHEVLWQLTLDRRRELEREARTGRLERAPCPTLARDEGRAPAAVLGHVLVSGRRAPASGSWARP